MMPKSIVFLYTELAEYFLACIEELTTNPAVQVTIFHFPINPEAPFKFREIPAATFYDISAVAEGKMEEIVGSKNPDIIFCSGWVEKRYLAICKKYQPKIPTVLLLDNHWNGGLKQRLLAISAPFYLRRIFNKAWVPGAPQKAYARKLGFKESNIKTGFYCADVALFSKTYIDQRISKEKNFPKRLLYVGRYLPFKGIVDLWEAFAELCAEMPETEWELTCLGTGDLWEDKIDHPKINHHGFVQPKDMPDYLAQTGVFVLPSFKEPWGVVVQEMAVAGFPIVCSDAVGAASQFLEDGKSGLIFKAQNKAALKAALAKIMTATDQKLVEMAQNSHTQGLQLTPTKWTETLLSIL